MAKGAYIGVPTYKNSLGDLEVGSTITLNVGGVATEFLIVHQGNPDNSLYDASCDGTWLLMTKCHNLKVWDSTDNDYANSDIHGYLNGEFLSLFDSNIQSAIKQVKLPYCVGLESDSIASKANGLSTKVFLLSGYEVGFTTATNSAFPIDGTKLDYFEEGSTDTAKNLRIAYKNTTTSNWWLRSPKTADDSDAWYVASSGVQNVASATNSLPIRPAVIFPSNLAVTNDTIDGSEAGCTSVARKIKKGYIGVENFIPRALPTGYTQVECIQSSGTQHINTGVVPNDHLNKLKIVIDFKFNSLKDDDSILGTSQMVNNTAYYLFVSRYNANQAKVKHQCSNDSVAWFSMDTERHIHVVDMVNKVCAVDNTQQSITVSCPITHELPLFGSTNANGEVNKHCVGQLYSCQIYDNDVLVRDYVPCTDSNGVAGLYDVANGVFYGNEGTGSFAFESSSVARKIKKAYIGIGGVARPCWSSGELAYYGTITPLSEARWQLAATTVGKYALFAGGQNNVGHTNVVDAYNTSLVRSTPTALQNGEPNIHATSVGKYAVFGAYYASYAYDESLTSTTLNPSNRIIENYGSATTVGDYALFAVGGRGTQLTAVSSSLTISLATALSNGRSHLSATAVGNYALFAGGDRTQYTSRAPISVVDAYDSSLTRTLPSQLSVGRGGLSATAVGNYALFGGGDISTTTTTQENTTAVDVYDTSLSRTTTSLSAATRDFAATTVGNYALFGGGINPTTGVVVSAFDQNLTRTTPTGLSGYRDYLAATAVGDYALFGGGRASFLSDAVDVYTIA